MSTSPFLLWLAGRSPRRDVRLARASRAEDERALAAVLTEDDRRFRDEMERRASVPHVELGSTDAGPPYRLPLEDLAGTFSWVTAATGSGKSRWAGALCDQIVAAIVDGAPVSLIVTDFKGEIADLVLRAVAARAQRLSASKRDALLARLITVRFFDGPWLPELELLKREPSVGPIVQAQAVAEAIEGAVSADLGIRQGSALTAILALAIEAGLSLLETRWLLYDHERLLGLAERSQLPEARLYVETRLARESVVTIDGLAARLDALLRVEAIKAAVAGPGMLDLRRAYEPGAITILDYGSAPLGAEGAKRALATLILTRLTWGLFDPARTRRGFTVIVADELQEALTPATIHHVERLVSTGRSFGAGLVSIHQSTAQLPAAVQSILATNVRFRVLGRSGEVDARLAGEWLPRTGRIPKPRLPGMPARETPEFLSEAEELRLRVAELGRSPQRHFLIADRGAPFHARSVTAPAFDPPALDAVAPAIRDAVLQGCVGRPRRELALRAAEIEGRAAEALAQRRHATKGGARHAPRVTDLPDVLANPTGTKGRKGAVP